MPLNPALLLGMAPIVTRQTLTRRDTMLYALGLGADELAFVYEDGLQALPTMPVVLGSPGFLWQNPSLGVTWQKLLHGEQWLTIHAPLPVEGEIIGTTLIEAVYDKGADKGALTITKREIHSQDGTHLATVRGSSFMRADGGFGGSSEGAPKPHPLPQDRAPDQQVTIRTSPNWAMIYRLSGDYNPLHIDPAVAKIGGFAAPILHGLCTYGIAGRAVLRALCDNDPTRLKRFDVRFSAPVYPGETILTEIWVEAPGKAAYRAKVVERDLVVLNNGYVEFA